MPSAPVSRRSPPVERHGAVTGEGVVDLVGGRSEPLIGARRALRRLPFKGFEDPGYAKHVFSLGVKGLWFDTSNFIPGVPYPGYGTLVTLPQGWERLSLEPSALLDLLHAPTFAYLWWPGIE
jgi:hypothetical protein